MPTQNKRKRSRPNDDDDDDDNTKRKKPLMKYTYDESESDSDSSAMENFGPMTRSRSKQVTTTPITIPKRKVIPDVMKDEDEDDESELSSDEDRPCKQGRSKSEYCSDEDENFDENCSATNTIVTPGASFQIKIGSFEEPTDNPLIPKRHNMKKEPPIIKKFVELVTKPIEEVGIDAQIDQFKAMDEEHQKQLLDALERRPTATDAGAQLMFRILTMKISPELQVIALSKYQALQTMEPTTSEYFKQRSWLDKFCSMPFGDYKKIPVALDIDGPEVCASFLEKTRECLDAAVYGQVEAKLQVLQWMANKIANPEARGKNLLLVGPAGIGKSSLVKDGIAKAIGWPFQFISMGGDSDASTYTGHQLVYESSHPGKIVNSLITAKSMSMVMMFDEVDKISTTPKGEEVQHMLIHLTDPVQNSHFEDKYLAGVPIDLSNIMFIFSANDITKIDRILLDRMNVITLKGYTAKEKLVIAENYLVPTALSEVALQERVKIPKEVLEHIISVYASEAAGVRELKRCIETIVQKVNMLRMFNSPTLPFYIKDFALPFTVTREHVEKFLKKRSDGRDDFPQFMYI